MGEAFDDTRGWECDALERFCQCQASSCPTDGGGTVLQAVTVPLSQAVTTTPPAPAPPPPAAAPPAAPAPAPRPQQAYTYTGRVDASSNPVVEDEQGFFYFTDRNGNIGSRVSPTAGLPPPQLSYALNGRFPDRTAFTVGTSLRAQMAPLPPVYTYTRRVDAFGNPVVQDAQGNVYLTTRGGYVGERTSLDTDLGEDSRFVVGRTFVVGVPVVTSPAAADAAPPAPAPAAPPPAAPAPLPGVLQSYCPGESNGKCTVSIDGKPYTWDKGKVGKDETLNPILNTDAFKNRIRSQLPPELQPLFDRHFGQIDWNQFHYKNTIPLQNNGEISYNDYDSGLASLTTTLPTAGATALPVTSTVWLFAGNTFTSNDGWGLEGDKLVNKDDKREITFSTDGEWQTMEDQDTDSGERTITRRNSEEHILSVEEKDKRGKTTSLEVWDNAGHRTGSGNYDDRGGLESFERYDENGRLTSVCYNADCAGNDETSLNDNENYWVTNDAVCQGTKTECSPGGSGTWESEDSACQSAASFSCKAIQSKEFEMFRNFEGGLWTIALGRTDTQRVIGDILGFRPGWESLSLWWAPDITRSWQKTARDNFDQLMLTEYVVPKALCDYDGAHKVSRPGESATFIEVSPGIVQFVGSITAEKTPDAGPVLCSEELPCIEGECGDDGICRENDEAVEGFFYKISWAVSAPADESFTPYIDEDGFAIAFNIRIYGERELWLYPASGAGTANTLRLENGASDRDTIVAYSPRDYNQVCILFGAPPKDLSDEEVHEICADITESTLGHIEWDQAGRPGSSGSSTGNIQVEDVGRAQI